MIRNSVSNAKIFFAAAIFFLLLAPPQGAHLQEKVGMPLFGIWENSTRFVEITPDERMRIVLKPYYAFVYEDEGFLSCAVTEERTFEGGGVYTLLVSYPGQRMRQRIPAAVLEGAGLYTGFYTREENDAAATATADAEIDAALSGFWVYQGDAGGIRLYSLEPINEFYCLYFDGDRYYRIRYWLTDARFRSLRAAFRADDGEKELSVPKFLRNGDRLYTCVTGTGTRLRNYESGTWEYSDGAISFAADKAVFAGRNMLETAAFRLADDGSCLLLGEPQLSRSSLSDMDAEMHEHNALRRPQRKPPLGFMELDFYWDEIERLRQ